VGTYKIGEFPWHNALARVLLLGEISQKYIDDPQEE
jgi:hypothetical protein